MKVIEEMTFKHKHPKEGKHKVATKDQNLCWVPKGLQPWVYVEVSSKCCGFLGT